MITPIRRARLIEVMRERHVRRARLRLARTSGVLGEMKAALRGARLGDLAPTVKRVPHVATPVDYARPGDKDPPPFSATGVPTVRNKVDELLYYAPRLKKCEHVWGKCAYYPLLRQCTKCRRTKPRKKVRFNKLLPLFKDQLFPPTDQRGRYHDVCIVNKHLLLKRSWYSGGEWQHVSFTLYVKFPKGWLWTGQFSEFQFDKLIRAVDPLLDRKTYDPVAVYEAAQRAFFRAIVPHDQLERLL